MNSNYLNQIFNAHNVNHLKPSNIIMNEYDGILDDITAKACYNNCYYIAAHERKRYSYCLGIVMAWETIPIEHAWLYDHALEKYVDPTFTMLREEGRGIPVQDLEYFLVKQLDALSLRALVWNNGCVPMIEHINKPIKSVHEDTCVIYGAVCSNKQEKSL